jgi:hypothetical protein
MGKISKRCEYERGVPSRTAITGARHFTTNASATVSHRTADASGEMARENIKLRLPCHQIQPVNARMRLIREIIGPGRIRKGRTKDARKVNPAISRYMQGICAITISVIAENLNEVKTSGRVREHYRIATRS